MEVLHCPDNIKVHFACAENAKGFERVNAMGVRYSLYTAYPYVSKMVFKGKKANELPQRELPALIESKQLHVIQDSGLFTLMFGAQKGKKDAQLMNKWYDALVEFTLTNAKHATVVEVDCQKVLGVEAAWDFRQRMKKDLPNNRIINVFHLEDGMKGLDRMIEFAEYIAVSVPELRFAGKKNYVSSIAKYIKTKKPSIDIHLLGCTELEFLRNNRFCTSCDSSSFLSACQYGTIGNKHIRTINKEKIQEIIGDKTWNLIRSGLNEEAAKGFATQVHLLKQDYQKAAGNQDYLPYEKD